MAKLKQKNSTNWLEVIITIIVIVWFAMIVAVQLYRGRGSLPPPRDDSSRALRDDEKQAVLQKLVSQEKNTLTKAQKEKMVQAVAKSSTKKLTVEEQQKLFKEVTK